MASGSSLRARKGLAPSGGATNPGSTALKIGFVQVGLKAFRASMLLLSSLVILEAVKTSTIPRPQHLLASFLAAAGTAGVLCQVSGVMPLSRLPLLKGTREAEVEFLAVSFVSLIQCSLLMKTNASGGIYMTWLTFVASCVNGALWLFHVLRADSLMCSPMEGKPVVLRCTRVTETLCGGAVSPSRPRVGLALGMSLVFVCWIVGVLLPWDDVAKHDSRWNAIRQTVTADGADAAWRAKAYWETQKPLILSSLKTNFTLHPYFSWTQVWPGARWDEIINQRITAMGRQLDEQGSYGFKIEKDKCAMFQFFQNQGIPIPNVKTIARDKEEAIAYLRSLKASYDADKNSLTFPMFLKGCHLTQGSDKGMIPIKEKHFKGDGLDTVLIPWLLKKWDQRPNDSGRPWAPTMNRLLDTLEAGMAFQEPFKGMRVSPYNTPLEVKVEVVWGRAYLGLFADYHDVIALRDGSLEFTCRDKACPEWWSHGNHPDLRLKWLVENGHMEAVWALAERAAQTIGIDEARIDIFIDPARPASPVVNEISLSSGHEYMYHTDYLAEAWAAPHLAIHAKKAGVWPAPKVRATNTEVHMQTKA
mmetsp:Transcript_15729/g.28256  ORF Transcript_15729/g.28256 Transcript_15729/m.28256 type:complete len:588 (+) Transcript_15729:2-1765(+)